MTLLTSQNVVAWHDRTAAKHKALDEWAAVQTGLKGIYFFLPNWSDTSDGRARIARIGGKLQC